LLFVASCAFLTLEFREVVVQPVKPCIQHVLVLSNPFLEWSQARGIQTIEAVASQRTTVDKTDLAEYPEVLGDLRLGDCELVDDCSDRHFPSNQHVKDLAAVGIGDRVENVDSGGGADHRPIICPTGNMS
jgi:hypothetical protein